MSDAPERIWLQFGRRGEILPDGNHSIEPVDSVKHAYSTYFHESYVAALEAQLAEAKGLLSECAADLASYVDHDYPEPSRSTYPSMKRRYERDMEVVYRVRTTLAKLEKKV